MKRVGIIGFCLAVALGLIGVSAGSASAAAPEFSRSTSTPVKEGEKITFTSTAKLPKLESVGKVKIACATATDKGEIVGATGINTSVTFKECLKGTEKCTSTGATAGEIVTNTFEGKLGNLKSSSTPGVSFAQAKEKTSDAEFTCGTEEKIVLSGGVVGSITLKRATSKPPITFVQKAGIQQFESLFGGTLEILSLKVNTGAAETAGLSLKDVLVLPEEIAISKEVKWGRVTKAPFKEGEKMTFTSTAKAPHIESVGKVKIACLTATDKGEIVGPTVINTSLTFKECAKGTEKCTSTGATAGEIVTNTFEGKLGFLKSGSTPGVSFVQEKGKTDDAEFTCGTAEKVVLGGGMVGSMILTKATSKPPITFVQKAGIQAFESLFGGTLETLTLKVNTGTAEQAGINLKDVLVTPEEIAV
jgi:hypothetical protein